MRSDRKGRPHLFWIILLLNLCVVSQAMAVPQCGSFESVSMPGRVVNIVPFQNGTAAAIGVSSQNASVPVLRYFDGSSWSEQGFPSELDGFYFSASGKTPDGKAWFAATRAFSVYEIEVAFVRVNGGVIDRIDITRSATGAPLSISATAIDDVWALTSGGDVFRFDGSNWRFTDVPAVFVDQHLNPKGIYAVSSNDVWIAGYGSVGKNADHGFVQHWNGNLWEHFSTPYDAETISHFFYDIDGSGADDIWIAGYGWGGIGTILMHWDGQSWSKQNGALTDLSISTVMTMEPGNAWALSTTDWHFFYWNGQAWNAAADLTFPANVQSAPIRGADKADLCDAWVVGDAYDGTSYQPWAARLVAGDVQPPPPEVIRFFVASTEISRQRAARKTYYASAVVRILDTAGNPVAGATVSGNFTGPTSESLASTTGADGSAIFNSQAVPDPKDAWCFSVANVEFGGAAYDETLNGTTLACEAVDGGGGNNGGGKGKNR